jgi:hypothetical protein
MDFWLPPKPAIILPAQQIAEPVGFKLAWLPGIAMPFAPSSAAPPPPSLEFRVSAVDATDLTTYTFSTVDIGVADSTRRVIVGVAGAAGAARTLSSATIGGVSATIHTNLSSADHSSLISVLVPTGTTATIVLTFSGGMISAGIGVYRLINETVSTPHATATDTTLSAGVLSTTIDVPSNGALVAVCKGFAAISPPTYTWSGATERYDQTVESADSHSGASETGLGSETGRTVSATLTGLGPSGTLSVLTWG